jgi:hypothetical protein
MESKRFEQSKLLIDGISECGMALSLTNIRLRVYTKDTSPSQWNNFPLERNTPSLAATFHQCRKNATAYYCKVQRTVICW